MLRDIAVFLPIDRPASALIDSATSVASAFKAHLDGIACAYLSISAMASFDAAAVALAAERDAATTQVATVLDQFEISARALGLARDTRNTLDVGYAATPELTGISRLYDLNIVQQPDPDDPHPTDELPEAILFGSGRPMLMIPYTHRGPVVPERILVCWDGGAPAARALHDALPFLRKASSIDVVSINEPEDVAESVSASTLLAHLLRRDLSARLHRLIADSANIHNTILSLAADNGSGLIVMGGYGHSRLRELVLGGTTRGIMDSMTAPILMSH